VAEKARYAKYLSSAGLKKSELLYNYDWVVDHGYKSAAIVEGIFDCYLIPNSVAILGKSISDFQARCFASTFNKALVALDLDAKDDVWDTAKKLYALGVEVEVLRYHRIDREKWGNSPGDFTRSGQEQLKISTLLECYLCQEVSYDDGYVGQPFLKSDWSGKNGFGIPYTHDIAGR
jgi:hypothetical protein